MILLYTLLGLMILPSLIGFLVIYHIFIRGKQPPADKSNRINHLRLFWFALTREDKFTDQFPWLKNDEWENVNDNDPS
ncbi:MAG: hypothetical protein CMF22_10585 [Idiomarinaceae bacterium]|nr:hypothetical protein [Idiomarinaceae bacterium]MBG23887.1 hypothetical protein [Idiomarinaceae bacterium]